jgi:hypothetical protein
VADGSGRALWPVVTAALGAGLAVLAAGALRRRGARSAGPVPS